MTVEKPNIKLMTDIELQKRCIEMGVEYVETRYPGYADLSVVALLQNAAAAGYAKGFRDAQLEYTGFISPLVPKC